MADPSSQNTIQLIHASGCGLVLSITGGGSGAIAALLEVGGASASVLEAIVPYAASALKQWLGGPPDHYCSERTARAMAMAAFERARKLSDSDPRTLRGIGATASLATTRPKRGDHRIHVAWQSAEVTAVASCDLEKDRRTRAEEEQVATQFILSAVAEACGLKQVSGDGCQVSESRRKDAPPGWTELLLGQREFVSIPADKPIKPPALLFPGAFNPLHEGHRRMAEIAAAQYGAPVTFELSIANVDKPPLDFIALADRLSQFSEPKTSGPETHLLLTRAPTFVDKARLAPGCTFIVGIDTLQRIADPRYYTKQPQQPDAAIAFIAKQGCRFLVFGRSFDGRFTALSQIEVPPALRLLCDEVPEVAFRADISSSELRKAP